MQTAVYERRGRAVFAEGQRSENENGTGKYFEKGGGKEKSKKRCGFGCGGDQVVEIRRGFFADHKKIQTTLK